MRWPLAFTRTGWLVLLIAVLSAPGPAAARSDVKRVALPAFTGPVQDQTGTLNPAEQAQLLAQLQAFEHSRSVQVAVLLIPTTGQEDIAAYTQRVLQHWQWQTGILITVAKADRQIRIAIGQDLSASIPDATASRIIAEQMAPLFRTQHYAQGIGAALQTMADHLPVVKTAPLPGKLPRRKAREPVATPVSALPWTISRHGFGMAESICL